MTQSWSQSKAKSMKVYIDGKLQSGVNALDTLKYLLAVRSGRITQRELTQ
jgi:homoaconitase/3-isopropylmalate dehydratase large subunit